MPEHVILNLYAEGPIIAVAKDPQPLTFISLDLCRDPHLRVPKALAALTSALEAINPPPQSTIEIHDAPYDIAFGLDNMFRRRTRQWTTKSGRRVDHVTEWMAFCNWIQERQLFLSVEYPK